MQELSENIVSAVKEIKSAIIRAQSRVAANANAEMLCSPAVSKLGMVTAAEFMSLGFSHHMTIISQTDTLEERLFYIREAAQNHWGRDRLSESIKRDDFHHRGAMPSNFTATIPDTTLARKTLTMFRDEYLLDFINLDDIEAATGEDVDERVVEKSIVANILCQSADRPYVEYAIRDYNKPLGVATYRTADEMPENLKRALPPIDELRRQLAITGDAPKESEENT